MTARSGAPPGKRTGPGGHHSREARSTVEMPAPGTLTDEAIVPHAAARVRTPASALHADHGLELAAGLRCRRAASWALPPLECGHADPHRDPLDCLRRPVTLTPVQLDGWRAAIDHLTSVGADADRAG
jgi:hypothetical protein